MAFVQGITRSNYDTVGARRLTSAEANLKNAIQQGADSSVLLVLQKEVDDLKNTIKANETKREKFLDKLSLTERRVQEAKFEDLKRKFDEADERASERTERVKENIRSVSNTLNNSFGSLADSVAHTLLGPLNLIVNPLEKALNFNIFKIAKKPVADFIQGKFPSTYDNLKKNGGVIGAVGVAIIDAIQGKKNAKMVETGESDGFDLSSVVKSAGGIGPVLKYAGVAALVVACIAGIVAAWKNEWDTKGIESGEELKDLLKSESASTFSKIVGTVKFAVKAVFGSVVAGMKGMLNVYKESFNSILDVWKDPEASAGEKIWETVKTTVVAIPKAIWSQLGNYVGTLGDYVVGLFGGDKLKEKWSNFKSEIGNTFSYMWNSISKAFSWDNIKASVSELFTNPGKWISGTVQSINNFFNNIFSGIGKAITNNEDFDFNAWIHEKVSNAIESIKTFFTDIFEKVKNAISGWWDNTKLNPSNWFGTKETIDSSTGEIITQKRTIGDVASDAWNGLTRWLGINKTNVNDAIISKDNDLYIPSPDDNIVLTKNTPITQPIATNTQSEFQNQLMEVLREIATNLRQPTVINNLNSSGLMSFETMRL